MDERLAIQHPMLNHSRRAEGVADGDTIPSFIEDEVAYDIVCNDDDHETREQVHA